MKRKDTKVYQSIVEDYCSTRHNVEFRKESISESYENIGRAKAAYDMLANKNNEEIKKWYNFYTDMLRMSAGMTENLIKGEPEKVKALEHTLKEDYLDDTEKLYDEWLAKEHLKRH